MLKTLRNIISAVTRRNSHSGSVAAEDRAPDADLRRQFKLRYIQFRQLLRANAKALQVIAELEEALTGSTLFDMPFIHARVTRLCASVYQIIEHLNALADNRHTDLYGAFDRLQQPIMPMLDSAPRRAVTALTFNLTHVDATCLEAVGVKMARLGDIARNLALRVPPGFVITTAAGDSFMVWQNLQERLNQQIQSDEGGRQPADLYRLSSILQQLILDSEPPPEVLAAIQKALAELQSAVSAPLRLAVRSSSVAEDLPGASFAGQYRSLLNVHPNHIVDAYKEVIAAKYGVTAMSYRRARGLRDDAIGMAAGCLQMVPAVAGGVVYTANPLDDGDDTVLITAAWGLPKLVVDGRSAADRFTVARQRPDRLASRQLATKTVRYQCLTTEGLERAELTTSEGRAPSLTDVQVLELARLAVQIEEFYGHPQDIEWALDEQARFVILQSRPLRVAPVATRGETATGARGNGMQPEAMVLTSGSITASRGMGAGPIRILRRAADRFQFAEGEVMVLRQALPDYAALLPRAAAVIAEHGSLSSHLANVAREYQVPALFGVENATSRLQNGQMVTVDADARKVYTGRVDASPVSASRPARMMVDTPVHHTLKTLMPFIAPLTLLDSEAPNFTAAHCQSLHDIVRYCHEYAVRAMFEFGHQHAFPHRSSKQLIVNVPMQWWILNLDDGFSTEIDGPAVRLEEISSLPMLALWEGITKAPWQGPPPIDGKGLMSVMFEATRNTALVPGLRSRYAQRNYFMIARNYCSLTSRFGFHFATVESYVSSRAPENYIIFGFKGGAADDVRKIRRVQLISGLLEDQGFRVRITSDALRARFEDLPAAVMQHRLNIVGYLIMHTRQLDMVMSSTSRMEHYRKKITTDIEALFQFPV